MDFQRFAVGGDGGGVVFVQFVTESAQVDGNRFIARCAVLPVFGGAGGACQHFGGLVAEVVSHPCLICSPACVLFIVGGEGVRFGLFGEPNASHPICQ